MKPALLFVLGLLAGSALTAIVLPSRSTPSAAVVAPPGKIPPASTDVSAKSPEPVPSVAPAIAENSLESALREIREAGMVVIPQEFARFLMPSLLSTNPERAVKEVLKLDETEAAAFAKARMNFDRALQQSIDSHLRVIDVKDGVVTASLPAFREERQKLIDAWRSETLAGLDTESAAMTGHIDFERAMENLSQGRLDLNVTFRPSQDAQRVSVEYQGETSGGGQRRTYRYQTKVPAPHFLRQFPSLKTHFPQLSEDAKR